MEGLKMKYFVLKPKGETPYHNASRMAMLAYAKAIDDENPKLKQELINWVFDETPQTPNDEKS